MSRARIVGWAKALSLRHAYLERPKVGTRSLSSGRPEAGPVGFAHPTDRFHGIDLLANVKRLPLVVAFVLLVAATARAREFRAADNQTADYPSVRAVVKMGELIEVRTGGRHRVRVFDTRALGEEKETIEQTRAGAIDINRVSVVLLGSLVPAADVLALPFLFRSIHHLHQVLDGPIGDEILASFERYGLIGLTFYDSGARSIYTSKLAIQTPADLKGLRIRVQQSALMADMMRSLGAVPVELPYGQVETGLTAQIVDGAENNWPSYVTTNHYKVAPFYTLTEHTMSPGVLVMSLSAWQSLSDEDKTIFRAAARESSVIMRGQWNSLEVESRRKAQEAGAVIVSNIDRKPFEDAMADVYRKAAANPAIAPLLGRIRQAM
jgi:tripartite ATP-independent transporter DctP family solute receptor